MLQAGTSYLLNPSNEKIYHESDKYPRTLISRSWTANIRKQGKEATINKV
jgi:hypothetical protein